MKRLACFLLEGLIEQGPHRVWVTLGTFDSQDAARRATQSACHPSVVDTRVIALYRDSGVTAASSQRAHFAGAAANQPDNSTGYTVA